MSPNASRRRFLRTGTTLALAQGPLSTPFAAQLGLGLAGLGAMAAQQARAADTSGYKALVCLYMVGGNDSHNWIVPTDATNYGLYRSARNELAWARERLLPITASNQGSGRSFGMPGDLQPLRDLYESGQCVVVPNVGPLTRPITKADYLAGRDLPSKLFSHNDQSSTWLSLQPEGAPTGWGGRMADLFHSANAYPVFTAMSSAGNSVFLSGRQVVQYQVGPEGPVPVTLLDSPWAYGSRNLSPALKAAMASAGANDWQTEYARITQRGLDSTAVLRQGMAGVSVPALSSAPVLVSSGQRYVAANCPLARQLRVVAQLIGAGSRMNMRRQVFMVQLGGFDTHNNQMRDQPLLMARVAQGTSWFLQAMSSMGLGPNVTLFTASDFGRSLVSNGDGCDHGWGAHHFVAGGAVRGRRVLGNLPLSTLGTNDEVGSGRLLPSISVTQYAATLGAWMGLSPTEVSTVLPELRAFSQQNLGIF